MKWIPNQRDIVFIDFDPSRGYEVKKSPAFVMNIFLNIPFRL